MRQGTMGDEPIKWGDDGGDEKEKKGKEKREEMDLPAEVTSRRVHKVSKEEVTKAKDEFVSLNWDDIFPKKPRDRLRWLYKAFVGAKEGRVKANPLFDIIVHRKFLEGLSGNVATDVLNLIRGNLDTFSAKQQKQLTSDNFELFRKYAPIAVLDSDDDEADAPALPPPPKVVIEEKSKKGKKGAAEEERRKREREEEEEGYDSNDDVETKRRRILAKGVERRVDPTDGQAYTMEEFIEQYGGSGGKPPVEWENARHSAFIFKQ